MSMKTVRRLSRRSFLGRVVGGAAVGGSALLVLGGTAEAYQVTDNDSGPNSDPPGRGRGRSGLSDSDPVDVAGNGRGARHTTCTDSDSGPNSDGAGRGRGNGVSDNDTGAYADAARCGRGPARR
jgi:hypothetical protein